MEIIQEIGSYAGLAAVVGLAVLSALYFSQARDVKRLREWAGRAPERVDTPVPGRVVAQPVPKPPVPKPPVSPAKPGVPAPAAATPAAAAAAGAAPAVATGPAAPAETEQEDDEEETSVESSNGTDEQAVISQDTEIHPPPAPPDEDEDVEHEEGDEDPDDGEGDGRILDEDPDREPAPEDFHEDYDPDSEEFEEVEDTGDEPALAPPLPPPPPRPTIPIGGASRSEPTGILPPYEESRPGGPVRGKRGGGGVFSSTGRAVAVVGGSLLALLAIGFGVLQLTGDDDEPSTAGSQSSAQSGGEEEPKDTPAKKKAPGINPGDVRVAVLNGTTVPGLAAQIGDSIERQGFQLGTVTNFIDQQRAESVVKYAPGAEREAAEVGKRLKISQREPIDAESQGLAGDGADKTQ